VACACAAAISIVEKAAKVLLQDYRDGLLGRISLETPATRSAMLAAEQASAAGDAAVARIRSPETAAPMLQFSSRAADRRHRFPAAGAQLLLLGTDPAPPRRTQAAATVYGGSSAPRPAAGAGRRSLDRLQQRLDGADPEDDWDVQGIEGLDPRGWYLVNCNHQSWADILVLQHLLTGRIPCSSSSSSSNCVWVPVMGLAWWALDFPFMRRHSEEVLKAHPELRGKDQEATRLACEKFSLIPTSVMNFCEGTRFTAGQAAAAAVAVSSPPEAESRWYRAGSERDGRQVPRHPRRYHRLSRRCAQFLGLSSAAG
jgi:hypothetical protein